MGNSMTYLKITQKDFLFSNTVVVVNKPPKRAQGVNFLLNWRYITGSWGLPNDDIINDADIEIVAAAIKEWENDPRDLFGFTKSLSSFIVRVIPEEEAAMIAFERQ